MMNRRTHLYFALVGFVITVLLPLLVVVGTGLNQRYLPVTLRDWPRGRLVISEVMYDSSAKEPDGEWVEFYNTGNRTLDLSTYKFGDEESIGGGEGMLQFPDGARIEAGQVIVVASYATTFEARYGQPPDYEMRESDPLVPNMLKYTAWAGGTVKLDNSGDEVLVLDEQNAIVDALSYGSSTYFFDPAAEKTDEDQSLERSPVTQDSDSAMDWIVQMDPDPGHVDLSEPTPSPSKTPDQQFTSTPPVPIELLISEVLYDPIGGEPDGEWIELYNAGGSAVTLTGYKIGDEETQGQGEGMYRFPDGASIPAMGAIVIANQAVEFEAIFGYKPDYELVESDTAVPNLEKYADWSNGSIYMSNTGDDVLILSPDDSLVDALSWGDSTWAFDPAVMDVPEGHSVERRPADQDTDSAADWIDSAEPNPGVVEITPATPTATSTSTSTPTGTPPGTVTQSPTTTATGTPTTEPTPVIGHLLVSEVLYDPAGSEPANEWIELYNAGGSAVTLTGYKIGDEETQGQGEGMYRFPDGASIPSMGVIVIANQAVEFEAVFGYKPDYELVESDAAVPNLEKYAAWANGSLALSNTGDDVLILSPDDSLVDAVSWGSSTWAFDPAAPDVAEGHSLERSPPGVDTDSTADWIDQESPSPGQVGGEGGWLAVLLNWLLRLF